MGIFSAISGWMDSNQERNLEKMRTQGKCPECRGNGYNAGMVTDHMFIAYSQDLLNCPGCDGSGAYSDWEAKQNLQG